MIQKETKAVCMFLGAYVAMSVVLLLIMMLLPEHILAYLTPTQSIGGIFGFFLLQEIVLLGMLRAVWSWYLHPSRQRWGAVRRERRHRYGRGPVWKYVLGGLFVYMLLSGTLVTLLDVLHLEIPGLYGEQMVMHMLDSLTMHHWGEYLLLVLMVAVLGPLVEEIIFRGVVTHDFMQERGFRGVVLAALVFAAIHAERAVVRNLVILSLFLGYIYRKTNSLRYSYLFHVLINALALIAMFVAKMHPELMSM